ncbi:hypothetical protein A2Z41_02620 [Microgenomates group bacterium RBG_19FT_COMBO_39_10]|nr:MAG: hypothetical protein A2Z41_02620 [Microgenomates group bacterium RBG_19FT_COMBO_39_10]
MTDFDIGEALFGEHAGLSTSMTLGGIISNLLPNIYVLAGIILFFLLISGGLMFLISAGQENPEGAAKGTQAVTAALIGFLIIFASYWIIQIIKVITGIDFLSGSLGI